MCGRYALGIVCSPCSVDRPFKADIDSSEQRLFDASFKNMGCPLTMHRKMTSFVKHTISHLATMDWSTEQMSPIMELALTGTIMPVQGQLTESPHLFQPSRQRRPDTSCKL
jgi:hypothetical protein